MVNTPPSSWQSHQHDSTMNSNHTSRNDKEQVNVYSTNTTVEVEAAAALMSLPSFGSSNNKPKKKHSAASFASLAAQHYQQPHHSSHSNGMVCDTTASPAAYPSSQQQQYVGYPSQEHSSATAPRFQFAEEAPRRRPFGNYTRTSSYSSDSSGGSHLAQAAVPPRFQFAAQEGYQSSSSRRRKYSSDSGSSAGSFHHAYTETQPPRFQFADQESSHQEQEYPSRRRRKTSYCSSSDSSVGSYHLYGESHGSATTGMERARVVTQEAPPQPRFQFADDTSTSRLDQHLLQGAYAYRNKQSHCSSSDSSVSSSDSNSYYESTSSGPWFPGVISLALKEDEEVLSPLHCFMRQHCVEAFSATAQDVATPRYGKSHGGKVVVGQVGIRCLHCQHRPMKDRPERSTCFPSSLKNIYHSIETWQRRHSAVCVDLPGELRTKLTELMQNSKSTAGGRRQYWQDAAKRLGLVDTPVGVRFARPPGLQEEEAEMQHESSYSSLSATQYHNDKSQPLVSEQDKPLVTEYLFLLMAQMETCRFSEEDRTGGRSKVKIQEVGFPGMQCRHCRGKAGFGRYFPQSLQALALANSDRNIANHVLKCRKCPSETKKALLLKQEEAQVYKKNNKRGSRKLFFTRIWERLHPSPPAEDSVLTNETATITSAATNSSIGSSVSSVVAATAESLANSWFK